MMAKVLVTCYVMLLLTLTKATQLSSNTSVACPDETVSFTCSAPGANIWTLTPPLGDPVFRTISLENSLFVGQMFMAPFLGQVLIFVVNDNLVENVSSTFTIHINNSSLLEGSSIECTGGNEERRTLNITIADRPSSPLNLTVSSVRNELSSSTVTVEWDPPSSPGGVSVSYVLTISPPPLSQSTLTVETTSAQISVSYNTQYNLTIKADNCAGFSKGAMLAVWPTVACPPSPTPADRVMIIDLPTPPVQGSTLTFSCNNDMITSMCGSDGSWSPNPATYDCQEIVTCDSPDPPSNGTVDVGGRSSPYSLGSKVTYRCDDGLFPMGVMTSVCKTVMGRVEWVEDPGAVVCRETPVNCTLPLPPVNGSIVDHERLNRTVVEGTVLTYHNCDSGLSPTGPTTITCTNAGQWSPDPATITCVTPATPAPSAGVEAVAGGVVGGLLLTVLIVIILVVLVIWCVRRDPVKVKSPPQVIEMNEGLQVEYSELRHDGPKKGLNKDKPPPANSEGYNRITHKADLGPYDDVTVNSEQKPCTNSEGYSTLNNGQSAQRMPGYGQLNNVATVESVVYADLGVATKKKRSEAPEVDQHTVTYSTLDMAATSRMKASTMPAPSKGGSVEQADKLLNLDQALVQLRPVQSRWKELADALHVPETYIQQVDDMYGKGHASSMTEIIDYWMRSCGGRPTWRELADALKRIKEDSLAQQLMSIYDTGQLPVELEMNEVPKELYKYDNAPPPPIPARSPTVTDTDSPGLSRTLPPPSKPPRHGGDHPPPSRPPKPPPKNVSPAPPRPPKPHPKN